MKAIACLFALVNIGLILSAQNLHTPAEMIGRLDKSKVKYSLNPVDKWENPEPNLQFNDYFSYQTLINGEIAIERYQLEPYGKRAFQLAEEAMQEGDLSAARENYKLILVKQPNYAPALTCIGLTFSRQGDHDPAVRYFRQAIQENFFDFMAHWSLALTLWEQKEKEEAAREIAIAWVLNRNEPRLAADAKRIFKSSGRKMKAWSFKSEYSIQRIDKDVSIRFTPIWMPYALVKALWRYEPGYAQEMGGGPKTFNSTEEREALFNLILTQTNNKGEVSSKDPALNKLWQAMQMKYFYEYIIFEIWLPEEPVIAFTQPKEAIQRLAQYVLDVRGSK